MVYKKDVSSRWQKFLKHNGKSQQINIQGTFSLRNLQDSKAILAVVPPVSRAWPPNSGKEHSTGNKPCPVFPCLLGYRLGENWFLCRQLPWQAPTSFQPLSFKATNPIPMETFSAFRGDSGCAPKLSEFSTYSDYYRFSSQERVCHMVERAGIQNQTGLNSNPGSTW